MPEIEILVEGEFSDDEISNRMRILGELIINKIRDNIRDMDLIIPGSGALLQRWNSSFNGKVLVVESGTKYGEYLEYGTYSYFSQYGFEDYPEFPDPKKKDLSRQARKMFPKGMQPFAFVRKVIYNESIMNDLVAEAFS